MKRKEQGFTLLELLLVFGMLAMMAVTEMQSKAAQLEQARARQVGIQLYQYNNAVRSYLAENIGATGTHTGTSWLKPDSCGGTAAKGYLPCAFPDQLSLGNLTLKTTLSTVDGATTARTTLPALTLAGKLRPDLAGLAALTASGGAVNNLLPTMATTDSSFTSDPTSAVITVEASTRADNDVWLRTDGGNSMHANLNFDSGDAGLRNITGVSRITSVANSVLTLGDAGINSRVLLNADTEVLGTLTARGNAAVHGNLTGYGNITGHGTLNIGGAIMGQSNLHLAGSAFIANNLDAGMDVLARGNLRTHGHLQVDGSAQVNGNIVAAYGMYTQRFYDANDTNFWVDPNAESNLNQVNSNYTKANRVLLKENVAEGGVCTTKEIGTRSDGELLSCVNGRWKGQDALKQNNCTWRYQMTHYKSVCPVGQYVAGIGTSNAVYLNAAGEWQTGTGTEWGASSAMLCCPTS